MSDVAMPARIARLPRDRIGRPIPWFVAWIDGAPEFRVADGAKIPIAIAERRCWVCGSRLGVFVSFVVGPMCAINRVSSEPPSHRDCARYSALACPFLTRPQMLRREGGLPEGLRPAGGEMIERNPGVALVWTTRSWRLERADGVLFRMGPPLGTEWYAEGRAATRDEVLDSIGSGLPLLERSAADEGLEAETALRLQVRRAMALVPA